jgi:small subunit ribosomal protein S16
MPVKTGIQVLSFLDSRFRGNNKLFFIALSSQLLFTCQSRLKPLTIASFFGPSIAAREDRAAESGVFSMVVIRLARGGAKKRPFFNIVAADRRVAATGRFIERVGFYDPKAPEGREALRVDGERLAYWRSQGAQVSPTVERLVKQAARKVA